MLGGLVAPPESQISVYWLISTYFLLTIAELFLSPIGISYVSKVAPPKYKGLMQGGWFAATAIGMNLVGLVGYLWMRVPLSALWMILVVACILSPGSCSPSSEAGEGGRRLRRRRRSEQEQEPDLEPGRGALMNERRLGPKRST